MVCKPHREQSAVQPVLERNRDAEVRRQRERSYHLRRTDGSVVGRGIAEHATTVAERPPLGRSATRPSFRRMRVTGPLHFSSRFPSIVFNERRQRRMRCGAPRALPAARGEHHLAGLLPANQETGQPRLWEVAPCPDLRALGAESPRCPADAPDGVLPGYSAAKPRSETPDHPTEAGIRREGFSFLPPRPRNQLPSPTGSQPRRDHTDANTRDRGGHRSGSRFVTPASHLRYRATEDPATKSPGASPRAQTNRLKPRRPKPTCPPSCCVRRVDNSL